MLTKKKIKELQTLYDDSDIMNSKSPTTKNTMSCQHGENVNLSYLMKTLYK